MNYKIKSEKQVQHLTSQLGQLRREGNPYADVDITVGGAKKKTFKCHSLILILNSNYFETLTQKSEIKGYSFCIPNIDPDIFEGILDFMYSGEMELRSEFIPEVFSASVLLRLDELRQICLRYMLHSLSEDNVMGYWLAADRSSERAVAESCKQFFVQNFRKMLSPKHLTDLSEEMFEQVLLDDNLPIKSEVDVCEMLMKWIDIQTENGKKPVAARLLPFIRWPGVHVEYIKSTLLSNTTLTSNKDCFAYLSRVISYHFSGIPFPGLLTFQRNAIGFERRAVSVGVNTYYSITPDVIQLSLQAPYGSFIDERLPTKVSDQASAAVLGYVLYVSGIGQEVKEIWRWDVISGWARCCDLICGRQRHCSSFVGTTLYLLGGITKSDKEVVGTIERFDTVANICRDATTLSHPIQAAACVSHGTTIYIFGGLNSEIQTVDYVQAFDTVRETCNVLSPSIPCSNFLLRPALWDNCVILMGADTCLIFDILRHTWQERRHFKADVIHFGMAVENQRLYVFGGGTYVTPSEPESKTTWVCTDRVKSISVEDVIQDRPVVWSDHGKLAKPCLVHAFAVMTLPKK